MSVSLAVKISFALRYETGIASYRFCKFYIPLSLYKIDSEGTYLFVWHVFSGVFRAGVRPMRYCVVLAYWRRQLNKAKVPFFVNVKVRTGGVFALYWCRFSSPPHKAFTNTITANRVNSFYKIFLGAARKQALIQNISDTRRLITEKLALLLTCAFQTPAYIIIRLINSKEKKLSMNTTWSSVLCMIVFFDTCVSPILVCSSPYSKTSCPGLLLFIFCSQVAQTARWFYWLYWQLSSPEPLVPLSRRGLGTRKRWHWRHMIWLARALNKEFTN